MKKTILSFLCIGSTCLLLAQQTKPSSDPNVNRNNSVNQSTQNNNNLNNPNGTLNSSQTNPVNSGNGVVNGHNTMTNENRANPGNNSLNNTPANSTLNGNTPPTNNMNSDLDLHTNTGTLRTPSSNTAYSVTVPTSVHASFQAAYPGISNATWHQSGVWYRARYMENGRLMEASYREDGKTLTREASPIMKTYVPQEAMNKALEMYGANVYAIAMTKSSDGQDRYNVTVIENGEARTEWMNADGSTVASPYRTETEQTTNINMNTQEQSAEPVQATEPEADRNGIPPNHVNPDDSVIEEPIEGETLDQGTETQQVDPNNNMNNDAINDATTSDEMMQRMNDERMIDNSPEDRTPEEATGTDPMYE